MGMSGDRTGSLRLSNGWQSALLLTLAVLCMGPKVESVSCVDGICGAVVEATETPAIGIPDLPFEKLLGELEGLRFDHNILLGLPRDPIEDDSSRAVEPGVLYSSISPRDPFEGRERHLVTFNIQVATMVLGMDLSENDEEIGDQEEERAKREVSAILSGARAPPGAQLLAYRYAGHQFGEFVGQLGDGRALSWGHVLAKHSEESNALRGGISISGNARETLSCEEWVRTYSQAFSSNNGMELSLKGTGPTPYSRQGDGLAVVRSSVREYLASAALAGLRVPTSLALSLVIDPARTVLRDPLDEGYPLYEQAAVVVRVAPSWLRFGTFEALFQDGKLRQLRELIDHTIATHFEHLVSDFDRETRERSGRFSTSLYQSLLKEVITRTAHLVAHWMANGFCHGVMNTDNMSVLGITIDLGPFGFMGTYDPNWVCNHSDYKGRYKFGDQPSIGMWNVKRFSDTFVPFIQTKGQMAALRLYFPAFREKFVELMRLKLGLGTTAHSSHTDTASIELILELLTNCQVDYNSFFRELTKSSLSEGTELPENVRALFSACAEEAYTLDSNMSVLEAWYMLYRKRFEQESISEVDRIRTMAEHNPVYVLRNHVAQELISQAESLDFSSFPSALALLSAPFKAEVDNELHSLFSLPATEDQILQVGCSS